MASLLLPAFEVGLKGRRLLIQSCFKRTVVRSDAACSLVAADYAQLRKIPMLPS